MNLYVLFACFSLTLAKDLPSYFPRCHVDDPEISKCLIEATKTLKPYLKKGIPEFQFPALTPLSIPKIAMEQGAQKIQYKILLTNVTINGMDDYEFFKFDYDPTAFAYHSTAAFKSVTIEGDFDMDGKIVVISLNGTGKLTIVLGNTNASLDLVGELVNRDGEEYYHLKSVRARITTIDPDINLDGEFGGSKDLKILIKKVIEDNKQELVNEVMPAVEEVAEDIFLKGLAGVLQAVPYKKLLPPLNV